jgi:hypothetical protein
MTISANSKSILEHPFTKRAVEKFLAGDMADFKLILDILQIDTYQQTACTCVKAFRAVRGENTPVIEKAIREVEPPTRLNTTLPIPTLSAVKEIPLVLSQAV